MGLVNQIHMNLLETCQSQITANKVSCIIIAYCMSYLIRADHMYKRLTELFLILNVSIAQDFLTSALLTFDQMPLCHGRQACALQGGQKYPRLSSLETGCTPPSCHNQTRPPALPSVPWGRTRACSQLTVENHWNTLLSRTVANEDSLNEYVLLELIKLPV